MGEKISPLEERYGHFRFLLKSLATFIAFLTVCTLLKDFWKPIDQVRQLCYDNWWFLPLLFVGFLPIHLIYEVLLVAQQRKLDAKRTKTRIGQKTRFRRPPKRRR